MTSSFIKRARKMWSVAVILLVDQFVQVASDTLWNRVDVDNELLEILTPEDKLRKQIIRMPLVACGPYCEKSDFCSTWCYHQGDCIITDAIVSPLYASDKPLSDKVKCYTSLEKDLAVGSMISSSSVNSAYPQRVAENLVRGIYNRNSIKTCTGIVADAPFGPWILFDLGKSYKIKEVRIRTQSYSYAPDLPDGAVVRIGKTLPTTTGEFSVHKVLGVLPNTTIKETTYTLKSARGIEGRYVSIQKDHTAGNFALCYILIL